MLYLNGSSVIVGHFPNGESYADVRKDILKEDINVIKMKFETDEDILFLQFLKDFVDEYAYGSKVILNMAYIPYSRMDRQEENRLFTLKSFARIVNSLNFDKVIVMEPHSEVSVALLNRAEVVNKSAELALEAMMDVLDLKGCKWMEPAYMGSEITKYSVCLENLFKKAQERGIYLVYPDAGAEKRYKKQIKYPNVITCSKVRDFNTGNINSIKVNNPENVQDCKIAIIVDDLSSKGGTFIGAAKELKDSIKGLENVILCVTHCENTILDGSILKTDDISKVYTTDSIFTVDVFKCEHILNYANQNKNLRFGKMIIVTDR